MLLDASVFGAVNFGQQQNGTILRGAPGESNPLLPPGVTPYQTGVINFNQEAFSILNGQFTQRLLAPLDRFFTVVLPLSRRGLLTAITLGFAHTLGEFGVVLMIGGNIPGRTRVLSIAIYDHVERLEYGQAHLLSAGMLLFSVAVLWTVYSLNRRLARVG